MTGMRVLVYFDDGSCKIFHSINVHIKRRRLIIVTNSAYISIKLDSIKYYVVEE